jgi:hypothetical protein
VQSRVEEWTKGLEFLVKVTEVDAGAAYSLLVKGFITRWKYTMRTTPTDPAVYQPMEEILSGPLSEALFGITSDGLLRKRLKLPCRHAGMGILDPTEMAVSEYEASIKVTKPFSDLMSSKPDWTKEIASIIKNKKLSREVRNAREEIYKKTADLLEPLYSGRHKVAFKESRMRGNSGVLTTVPTVDSGVSMPGMWWTANVQLRLGISVTDLPQRCPDCGCKNTNDHALGGGATGGCGGARGRRHNEVNAFMTQMAKDAKLHVVEKEPLVPKLHPGDKETRCDGIIRGLLTPQREAWIDTEVVDTGAISYLMMEAGQALDDAATEKRKKHAPRLMAAGHDFVPLISSVYGTPAFDCQRTIKTCTDLMLGKNVENKAERSHLLHLHRARFQASVWRATALCLLGRRGRKQEAACEEHDEDLDHAPSLPWSCITADAGLSND